jgi:uroporphyrinogen decarboxylase
LATMRDAVMPPEPTNPLRRVLAGESVWPPPIWLMRQAGRYLPEYRAARAGVSGFLSLATTPDLAADITLQPIRRFRFDAAILFSDILILPWALGQGLEYKEGEGPVLPPLRNEAALRALNASRASEKTAPIMETVRRVRAALATEGFSATTLIGFAGAPFTVACYMIEGSGSRDFAATRTMAWREPALFDRIMDLLVETTVDYLAAQYQAGAEALMLFDTWAGLLPPGQFHRYVTEPARRIVAALRDRFTDVPIIGFPRMAGLSIEAYARETGVNAVGLDTAMDLAAVRPLLPASVAAQGNLDPLALLAGGEGMTREAHAILTAMKGRPFIFNLGHGVLPATPPENVAALTEFVRAS